MDARFLQRDGSANGFLFRSAVAHAFGIGLAEIAEAAGIPAIRRKIDKAVREDVFAEFPLAHAPCRAEQFLACRRVREIDERAQLRIRDAARRFPSGEDGADITSMCICHDRSSCVLVFSL